MKIQLKDGLGLLLAHCWTRITSTKVDTGCNWFAVLKSWHSHATMLLKKILLCTMGNRGISAGLTHQTRDLKIKIATSNVIWFNLTQFQKVEERVDYLKPVWDCNLGTWQSCFPPANRVLVQSLLTFQFPQALHKGKLYACGRLFIWPHERDL